MSTLAESLGIAFRSKKLLQQAFTHSSYVNEHRLTARKDNERLEYLGDAVLELAVSEFLFETFPRRSEGELTRLRAAIVCEPSLARFAEQLSFGTHILLGKGEEMTGGRTRPSILADVFESFLAALYLDQGFGAVKSFLQQHMFPHIESGKKKIAADFKTGLQVYTQQRSLGAVEYRIVDESGPSHAPQFTAEAYVDGELKGQGTGNTKKEAERLAAKQALARLKQELGK